MQQVNTLEIDVDDISLYVENETGIIFEAKFFEDYAILRPVTPELFHDIRKISFHDLTMHYDDFCGNRNEVLEFMATGRPLPFTQETRH